MLIREVPIFVLSHKNSRVLEGGREGKGRGEKRRGGVMVGWACVCTCRVGVCVCVREWRRGGWGGGADGEREAGDALSMHGSRKK